MKTVEKAFAYITQGRGETARLLVFRRPDFPEAGVQVPAGTIDRGETPEAAVLREAQAGCIAALVALTPTLSQREREDKHWRRPLFPLSLWERVGVRGYEQSEMGTGLSRADKP